MVRRYIIMHGLINLTDLVQIICSLRLIRVSEFEAGCRLGVLTVSHLVELVETFFSPSGVRFADDVVVRLEAHVC